MTPLFLNLCRCAHTRVYFLLPDGQCGAVELEQNRIWPGFLTGLDFPAVPAAIQPPSPLKFPHSHPGLVSWLLSRVSGAWAGLVTAHRLIPLPPKPRSLTALLQKDIPWAIAQGQAVGSILHRVNHDCKPRALEWKVVCRGPAQTTRRIFCRVFSCHQGRDILKRPLPSMSDRLGGSE